MNTPPIVSTEEWAAALAGPGRRGMTEQNETPAG
jgi:hypothetical protein